MATKVTKYIGRQTSMPSGVTTDFTALNLFDNWLSTQDLVAQDIWVDALVCENQADADIANSTWNPTKYDATHYAVVRPYDGRAVNDLEPSGALDYGTSGIELVVQARQTPRIQVGRGVYLEGFRISVIDTTGDTATGLVFGIEVSRATNNDTTYPVGPTVLRKCRIKSSVTNSTGGAVRLANFENSTSASNAVISDNLFIKTGGAGYLIRTGGGFVQRCTFVSRGTYSGASVSNGTGTTTVLRNCAFIDCGDAPVTMGSMPPANVYNNFTNVPLAVANTGITYAANLVVSNTDLRPSSGSALTGAASVHAQGTKDIRNQNRGQTPDVGALQLNPAIESPTATTTDTQINGQTVTISGTVTGTVSSASASITPSNIPYNSGVAQSNAPVSVNGTNWTVTFTNVKVGQYSPTITFTNSGGSSAATNTTTINVTGASGVIETFVLDGQQLTIQGTTTGTPTEVSVIIPAAASSPNGAVTVNTTATLGSGTFSVVITLTAGNYDAAVVRFINSAGTSFPASGTSPITVLSLSGSPEAPQPQYVSATITLKTPLGANMANLTNLKWAWFDQTSPSDFLAPVNKGTDAFTDSQGVLSVELPNTTKLSGQIGWLIVTNSDGLVSTHHRAFSGPVAVQ